MHRSLSFSSLPNSQFRQGILIRRIKGIIRATWKEKFVIVFEGAIFYYASEKDLTPRGIIHLSESRVEEINEKKYKKKFVFAIIPKKGEQLVLVAPNEAEMKSWVACIKENIGKLETGSEPSTPAREVKREKKSATVYLGGKIADKIVSLGAGGKIAREFMPDETVMILDALRNFLIQKLGADKASKIEKDAMSLGVKFALLYKDKKIHPKDLDPSKSAIRILASRAIDGFEIPFSFSTPDTIESIREVQAAFRELIKPVLSDNSIQKMNALFDLLANEDVIDDFFEKKKWKECEIVATQLRELWDNGQF